MSFIPLRATYGHAIRRAIFYGYPEGESHHSLSCLMAHKLASASIS